MVCYFSIMEEISREEDKAFRIQAAASYTMIIVRILFTSTVFIYLSIFWCTYYLFLLLLCALCLSLLHRSASKTIVESARKRADL